MEHQWTLCPLTLPCFKVQIVTELILMRGGCQVVSQARRSGRRRTDWSEACQMPTHSLSVNLLPLPTTVAMESGSRENRLCQAVTKMLARGRLGLFLEAYFHAPYLQLARTLSGSQSENNCVEQESLSRGGHINRSTHIGSDAQPTVASALNPHSLGDHVLFSS